jgi:DNA-binding NarL/FixJ family response regulator
MEAEIEILIADDHPIVRQGLRQLIESRAGLKVVAEVSNGQEALDKLRQLKPQVVLLDVDMPGLDGFGVAQTLRDEGLNIKTIFLTVHREESFLNKALSVGARGYILKDSAMTDIVEGIRMVCEGKPFVSPAMVSYFFDNSRPLESSQGIESLTATERTVLKFIAEYKTTKEIASALFISPRTIDKHRANICQKLNLSGSHSLMKFALTHQGEL